MRAKYPDIDVREVVLVNRNDRVVTGGGVSLCIDTTLYLLGQTLGEHVADETARIMEYRRARWANRQGFLSASEP
jgi:transcriptional regulator GlxA family with amidase domain